MHRENPTQSCCNPLQSCPNLVSFHLKQERNPRLGLPSIVRPSLHSHPWFTRVKKAIDDMVAQLTKEKEDEIKHKDFCVSEFNTNELQTEKKERAKQDLIAKIEDLEQTIKALTDAIDKLKAEISEMQV